MRIVKKTLKGDLMGKTGFKKVGPGRGRGEAGPDGLPPGEAPPPPATKGPEVRPRGQSSLDSIVPAPEDLVIVSDPLHPRHGRSAALEGALPAPAPRTVSPEEMQAAAEAEADLAATHIGVTRGTGGHRGNVAQVKDGGVAVAVPPQPRAAAPPVERPAARPPAPLGTRLEGDAVSTARAVLAESLFRAFGAPGSKVQHPRGGSFHIQPRLGEGVVRTQHDLLLPLPAGHVVPHPCDIVVELEPRGLLVVDIVPSHVALQDLKARAFDALQLRRIDRAFSVLVFVRCPGAGMAQGQAEAIAHGYDVHFGVDEEHVHSEAKFQAVRNRIVAWLEAASAANRGQ